MMTQFLDEDLKENVTSLCRRVAGSREVVAACFYGPRVCGYADEKSDVDVLLVLRDYRPGLKCHVTTLNEVDAFLLVADCGAFERDVEQGLLGEFIAEKITVPYESLINEGYLRSREVRVKKRIVWELLENIVLEFPELSHELLIEAEYFLYETMTRRARLFPPNTYSFLNMLRRDVRKRNVESMMEGYQKALDELAEENWVTFSNGYVKINRKFIDAVRSRKLRVPIFLKSIQRAVFLHVLGVFPKMMTPFIRDEEIFMKSHRGVEVEELVFQLEDPKKHLLIPTPLGFATLSDKTTIEDFVRKTVPGGKALDIEIEEIGGVLNAVYLLTFQKKHETQRVVVKKFKDWLGFKWFPLALWALGTQAFAVLGRSRLDREYAVHQFLHGRGLPVPRVLYVSPKEGLIFEDFVEGENLVGVIKRVVSFKQEVAKEAALVREVGRIIAEAHKVGVALGDCKPENFIVTKDGKIWLVDLEQATRNGNQAWDVAEFLYYSGHYISPLSPADVAEFIAKEFIEGYLEAGGGKATVRKAGSPRYAKVFSLFTPPHVILAVSNLCKKLGEE